MTRIALIIANVSALDVPGSAVGASGLLADVLVAVG
jgi:hypothetical protein